MGIDRVTLFVCSVVRIRICARGGAGGTKAGKARKWELRNCETAIQEARSLERREGGGKN